MGMNTSFNRAFIMGLRTLGTPKGKSKEDIAKAGEAALKDVKYNVDTKAPNNEDIETPFNKPQRITNYDGFIG